MEQDRLIDLEVKIAHHEIAIEELQKTVFDQHKLIAALEKTLKQMGDRLDSSNAPTIGPGNEKPPHY